MNHPVHIFTKEKEMSPSAFISYCEFGGNMSTVGIRIDNHFDYPVCNCFRDKILNDQLCYEVDLEKFSDKQNIERELKLGFIFLLDYNEDRQVSFNQDSINSNESFGDIIIESDPSQHAAIYLDTIGR